MNKRTLYSIIFLLLATFLLVTAHPITHVYNSYCQNERVSNSQAFNHYFNLYQALKLKEKNPKKSKHQHKRDCLLIAAGISLFSSDFLSYEYLFDINNHYDLINNVFFLILKKQKFQNLKNKAPPGLMSYTM